MELLIQNHIIERFYLFRARFAFPLFVNVNINLK